MLIAGIVILLVGVSDLVIAAVLARNHAARSGGLGGADPSPVPGILRSTGAAAIVVGAVLIVIGLLS